MRRRLRRARGLAALSEELDQLREASFEAWAREVQAVSAEFAARLVRFDEEQTHRVQELLRAAHLQVVALHDQMLHRAAVVEAALGEYATRLAAAESRVADAISRVEAALAAAARDNAVVADGRAAVADLRRALAGLAAVADRAGTEPESPFPSPEAVADTVLDLDYAALERRFRGSPEEIAARQRGYLDLIAAVAVDGPVVDLGCGRGEFLDLVVASGLSAKGVDSSVNSVEMCRARGLDVANDDLVHFLRSLPDQSCRAVASFQVVEHLPFPVLLALLVESFRVLAPGGLLLAETPNGANVAVGGSTFWLDHTHVRPLHPELLVHLAEQYGYVDVRVQLAAEPPVPWRLTPDQFEPGDHTGWAVIGLQQYLLSGQDACLLATRPQRP